MKPGDEVVFTRDDTTFGRIDMVKGLIFKKYWCYYWGEKDGRVTDPLYGTYARWVRPNEIKKRNTPNKSKEE